MLDGRIVVAGRIPFDQDRGVLVVGKPVVVRDGQRAAEERLAIGPVRQLGPRGRDHRSHDYQGRQARHPPHPPPCRQILRARRGHDEHADQRQVGVPISHRLRPHLHQADHRNERPQVPEPSRRQVRPAASQQDDRGRHRRQGHCRRRPLPQRDRLRKRVEHRQVMRPDRQPEIPDVRHQGVLNLQGLRIEGRVATAPPACCTWYVQAHDAIESTRIGAFSEVPSPSVAGGTVGRAVPPAGFRSLASALTRPRRLRGIGLRRQSG